MGVKSHQCTWVWACFLLFILLAVGGNCIGTFASSIWRTGRFDGDVIATSVENNGLMSCLINCKKYSNCTGFNYQATTKSCEILSSALCDNDTNVLTTEDDTWRYYDLLDFATQEDDMNFREKPSCTEAGKCSAKCKRTINGTCSHDDQCSQGATFSQCVMSTNSSDTGNCQCDPNYWAYNATRCIHKISYSGFIWAWINKRIVNNMCNVTFTVKAPEDFMIRLMNNEDFYAGVPHYMIRIGFLANTKTRIAKNGILLSEASTPAILTNDFQNFTLSWCDGIINVGEQGQTPVLSYTDLSPIKPIIGIGFYSDTPDNHIFVPHNLVDPYFPTSESTGVIRTNGHDYHKVKLLPTGDPTSSINFTFECKAPRDCNVEFGQLSRAYPYYRIIFGSFTNTYTSLWGSRINGHIKDVYTAGILSNTEFRKFWISIDGPTYMMGKGDDFTPLINWTEPVDANFTHVSINSYDGDLGYFKILSHRQFHDYPNGGYV